MTSIRPISATDIPALLELVEQHWLFEGLADFEPKAVATQLQRLWTDPRLGTGWIAHDDRKPIDYRLAVYVFSLEHLGLTAEIDEFFVLPSGRGQRGGARVLPPSGLLKPGGI